MFDSSDNYPYVLWALADIKDKPLISFSEYALALGLIDKQAQDPRLAVDMLLRWYLSISEES